MNEKWTEGISLFINAEPAVAFLRGAGQHELADVIERGGHRREEEK